MKVLTIEVGERAAHRGDGEHGHHAATPVVDRQRRGAFGVLAAAGGMRRPDRQREVSAAAPATEPVAPRDLRSRTRPLTARDWGLHRGS